MANVDWDKAFRDAGIDSRPRAKPTPKAAAPKAAAPKAPLSAVADPFTDPFGSGLTSGSGLSVNQILDAKLAQLSRGPQAQGMPRKQVDWAAEFSAAGIDVSPPKSAGAKYRGVLRIGEHPYDESNPVVSAARDWLGTPYVFGGTSKKGIDCSAFTRNVYSSLGVSLPRTAREQFAATERVDSPQPGDLVFLKGTQSKLGPDAVSHVMIYAGGGKVIQAASGGRSKAVRFDGLNSSYNIKHFAGFGRVKGIRRLLEKAQQANAQAMSKAASAFTLPAGGGQSLSDSRLQDTLGGVQSLPPVQVSQDVGVGAGPAVVPPSTTAKKKTGALKAVPFAGFGGVAPIYREDASPEENRALAEAQLRAGGSALATSAGILAAQAAPVAAVVGAATGYGVQKAADVANAWLADKWTPPKKAPSNPLSRFAFELQKNVLASAHTQAVQGGDAAQAEKLGKRLKQIQEVDKGHAQHFLASVLAGAVHSSPMMAGAMLGGGAAGAVSGATAGRVAGAAAFGGAMLDTSTASAFDEVLRQQKVDTSSKDALEKFFSNPADVANARRTAIARGLPEATVNALMFEVAGALGAKAARVLPKESERTVIKNVQRALQTGAVEAAGGAGAMGGGYAAGRVLAGEKIDPEELKRAAASGAVMLGVPGLVKGAKGVPVPPVPPEVNADIAAVRAARPRIDWEASRQSAANRMRDAEQAARRAASGEANPAPPYVEPPPPFISDDVLIPRRPKEIVDFQKPAHDAQAWLKTRTADLTRQRADVVRESEGLLAQIGQDRAELQGRLDEMQKRHPERADEFAGQLRPILTRLEEQETAVRQAQADRLAEIDRAVEDARAQAQRTEQWYAAEKAGVVARSSLLPQPLPEKPAPPMSKAERIAARRAARKQARLAATEAPPAPPAAQPPEAVEPSATTLSLGNDAQSAAVTRASSEQSISRVSPEAAALGYGVAQPSELKLAPETFQYKGNHDPATGATGSLAGVKKWNPDLAGVVLTWVNPKDGIRYVVNGHNRVVKALELASAGDEAATRIVYRDIEAATAEEARLIGAITNIAEGKGTVIDAAKVFREQHITDANLEAWGVDLRGKMARVGRGLAGLSDELFNLVVNDKLSTNNGEIIGRILKGQPDVQMQLLTAVSKTAEWKRSKEPHNIDNAKLETWATVYAEAKKDLTKSEQGTLKGTTSSSGSGGQRGFDDMFDDFAQLTSRGEQVADIVTHIQQRLREDATVGLNLSKARATEILQASKVNADFGAMEEAGGRVREQARAALAIFRDNWTSRYRKVIDDAADALATAKTKDEREAVFSGVYEHIRDDIEATFSRGVEASGTGGKALSGLRSSDSGVSGASGQGAASGGEPLAESITSEASGGTSGRTRAKARAAGAAGAAGAGKSRRGDGIPRDPTKRMTVDPIRGEGAGPKKNIREIIADFGNALGKKFLRRSRLTKGARGVYYPSNQRVLLREHNLLDTAIHEAVHFLDDTYGVFKDVVHDDGPIPYANELGNPAFTNTVPKNPDKAAFAVETLAEIVRAWVLNPAKTEKMAPQVLKHFFDKIPPEMRTALENMSRDVRSWAGRSATERTLSNIRTDTKSPTLIDRLRELVAPEGRSFTTGVRDKLTTLFVDDIYPWIKGVKKAGELSGALPSQVQAVVDNVRRLHGIVPKMEKIFKDGMITASGEQIPVFKGGFASLFKYFRKDKAGFQEDMDTTAAFMVSQRVVYEVRKQQEALKELQEKREELLQKGDEDGAKLIEDEMKKIGDPETKVYTGAGGGLQLDYDTAVHTVQEIMADPALYARVTKSASMYRAWSRSLQEYLVGKGRLTRDEADAMAEANPYYVDMHRNLGEHTNFAILKEFEGSSREIENVYTNLLHQTHEVVAQADFNEAMQKFVRMLENPRDIHDGYAPAIDLSSIGARVDKGARESDIATGTPTSTMRVWDNGKEQYWQFHPDIMKAIKNWGASGDYNMATRFASFMRTAITHAPSFLTRNAIHDFQTRLIVSAVPGGLRERLKLRKWTAQDEADWQLSGGDQAGHYLRDRLSYEKLLKQEMRKSRGVIWGTPEVLSRLEEFVRASEKNNRLLEFMRAKEHALNKQGMTEREAREYAAARSRDTQDFMVAGTIVRKINSYIPFTSATTRGFMRHVEALRWDTKSYLRNAFLVAVVPQLATYYINQQMGTLDEYRKLPAYQRDLFYNFKIRDDLWLRIPKPFVVSILAAAVERMLDSAHRNKRAFEGFAGSAANALLPLDQSAIFGPFKPVVEVMTNRDVFRGRSIVPAFEQDTAVFMRKGTKYASVLGRMGQTLTGKILGEPMDARAIDHLVESLGDLGRTAEHVADLLVDRKQPANPTATWINAAVGLTTGSPVFGSPDVQYVMRKASSLNANQSKGVQALKDMLTKYQESKSPRQRDAIGKEVRRYAAELRPVLAELETEKRREVAEHGPDFKRERAGRPVAPRPPRPAIRRPGETAPEFRLRTMRPPAPVSAPATPR